MIVWLTAVISQAFDVHMLPVFRVSLHGHIEKATKSECIRRLLKRALWLRDSIDCVRMEVSVVQKTHHLVCRGFEHSRKITALTLL